ncbi:hypothetical protein QI334_13235 [Staphylococcus saprophyticus]|uniref:hypothetical protein n=1 Tax=Staphylococcus TaxID=1279 RepID=UPI00080616BE|nr:MULTISPECIES: hypothetical protein [Staphylococcus]ANQ65717.1 hypothetical protein AVJ22_13765 [Staphylococcus equorum]ANQ65742.1 hypothetical protein AVJ22_13905 [Staphylococcus equorum]MDW3916003.1 hypothetical protein [Staphylococcus saprophyticus]MDW3930624.1 hypothetical protein [Staphylococcus saprophyticus]MDW3935952.1 hypothetical protein [Staphylococcus saprophyticus]
MRYHLEVRRYSKKWAENFEWEKMDVVYGKISDNKQELEDIIEKYKDENGKEYCVEISDTTQGEGMFVIDNKVISHDNVNIPVIKLNSDIEKAF